MNESTERKLRIAYGKLISRNAEKITVTDLCKKADVSRATFYIYYKDIDEYAEAVGKYIILQVYAQANKLMCCSDADFSKLLKRENLLFDDYEVKILESMLSGSNYLTYATLSRVYYVPEESNSPFTEYAWENYRDEIDLFSRGYLIILIMGLINYDETSFRSDMRNCRSYYKTLCERFKK